VCMLPQAFNYTGKKIFPVQLKKKPHDLRAVGYCYLLIMIYDT
jgi:hypothetical protein